METKAKDWVAVVLAIGIATAVNLITAAMLWEAIFRTESAGLSENATQILTTAFGGIIGVLGGYVGYKAGTAQSPAKPVETSPAPVTPTTPTRPVSDPSAPPQPLP